LLKIVISIILLSLPSPQRLHKDEYRIQKYGPIKNNDNSYKIEKCGDYFAWRGKDKTLLFKVMTDGEVLDCEFNIDSIKVEIDDTRSTPAVNIERKKGNVVILLSKEDASAASCLPKSK